jgi:hypothetical protein
VRENARSNAVDESSKQIKRTSILKLGGAGALAAIAALLTAERAGGADTKPYPKPGPTALTETPMGMDYTSNSSLFKHKPKAKSKPKAPTATPTPLPPPTPVFRVLVTSTLADIDSADHRYEVPKPKVKGTDSDGCDPDFPKYKFPIYVGVWLK